MKLYQILSLTIISVLGFSVVGANSVQYTNPLNMLITHSQAEHLVGNINFTFFSELQGLNIGGINYSIVLNHWGINSYGNASLDMIFRNITTGTQNVAAEEYVILTNQSNQLYKNVLAIESGMNSSQTCNGITGNGYTITFSGIGCPNTDTLSTTIVNSTNFGMTHHS